jgi:hypothetical protein
MLPRANPLGRLARLRSPLWTAVLPGSIVIGTFGLLVAPSAAFIDVLIAAVTTPVLALLAVLFVARARAVMLVVASAAGCAALLATGLYRHLGTSVVTALACLMVGVTLHRLIPGRWLLIGFVAMSAVDIALLATGFSYHQTAVLAAASNNFHGPRFTGAHILSTTIGYPDLFLAALLGAFVAGSRDQLPAALLLVVLASAFDSLLSRGELLPATVPIAATLVTVCVYRLRRPARAPRPEPLSPARPADRWPGPDCPATARGLSGIPGPAARTAQRTCPQRPSAARGSRTPRRVRPPER